MSTQTEGSLMTKEIFTDIDIELKDSVIEEKGKW